MKIFMGVINYTNYTNYKKYKKYKKYKIDSFTVVTYYKFKHLFFLQVILLLQHIDSL